MADAPHRPRPGRRVARSRPGTGQLVQYDVSNIPPPPHEWQDGGSAVEIDPGSFAARVESRRVNLVSLVRGGIPPRQYHALSTGLLVRGKRHLIAAPQKEGKSLVMLVHWVRMVLAGERIVILDRENGGDEHARRLEEIMDAWSLSEAQRSQIEEGLHYYEHPMLRRHDSADLVRYFTGLAADLIVLDSQRKFLTDLKLKENDSDDYSEFMGYAVDPLHLAGITTVILDNVGHADPKRSRGTIAKGDLNEIVFALSASPPFSRTTRGAARLTIQLSRFGDSGTWSMPIGDGTFGEWESPIEASVKIQVSKPELKPAVYDIVRAANAPMGWKRIGVAIRELNLKVADDSLRTMLNAWADDTDEPLHRVGRRGFGCD